MPTGVSRRLHWLGQSLSEDVAVKWPDAASVVRPVSFVDWCAATSNVARLLVPVVRT